MTISSETAINLDQGDPLAKLTSHGVRPVRQARI